MTPTTHRLILLARLLAKTDVVSKNVSKGGKLTEIDEKKFLLTFLLTMHIGGKFYVVQNLHTVVSKPFSFC